MKKSQKAREMTYEEKWMAISFLKANFNFKACALGFNHTTIADLYHKYSIKR